MLQARTGRPIVVALRDAIDPNAATHTIDDGYYGTLTYRPDQARAFLHATRPIATFGPTVTNEHYVVYLLGSAEPPAGSFAR